MEQTTNEKTLVFGISGRMASGKDTVGSWLLDNHVIGHLAAFADGVYAAAELVYGVTRFNKSGRARRLRQQIGSGMREISQKVDGHKEVWINIVERLIDSSEDSLPFAITDVRHVNEAKWVLDRGGKIIFLQASEALRQGRIEKRDKIEIDELMWKEWSSHESETMVDEIYRIYNEHPDLLLFDMTHDDFDENRKTLSILMAERWSI
ncbi:MAG: hypothetical protein KAR35_00710 [Candidatus Heimdallarchaeota archaeon]|nr:hypothetical protein [Candidatus Heimdallarchaeota archaeon]MCK5047873.1 hypothetical protein [Candidatus Heimdallarchaeota archaeon]